MSSEIRKNDVNLQAQVKPLPIYGLASDLTPTLRNRWRVGEGRQPRAGRGDCVGTTGGGRQGKRHRFRDRCQELVSLVQSRN
jgi:hypothetical protein